MRWEFENDKTFLKALNTLEAKITKEFGSPCKLAAPGCSTCRVWLAFNNLKVNL